jgi:hypothetical protein
MVILMVAGHPNNDFHVYNPASMTWFDLSSHALGTPPTARHGHGFTSAGGKLYVHGGYDGSGEHNRQNAEHFEIHWPLV